MKEVLKRKCTSFFKKEDREVVKDAVLQVHKVMTNASILMKAYYLQDYDEKFGKKVLTASDYPKMMTIDVDLLDMCCDVVCGDIKKACRTRKPKADDETETEPKPEPDPEKQKKDKKRNEKKEAKKIENKGTFDKLVSCFQSLDIKPIKTTLSLSLILPYSVNNLITAYNTNVWMHFEKYVHRYVRCSLMKYLNVDTCTKSINALVNKIKKHILEGSDLPKEMDDMTSDIDDLKDALLPKSRKVKVNTKYDAKSRPWVFLAYMVRINKMLETEFLDVPAHYRSLLNPFPMTTSFIPNHIRLDTSGMAQLLMSVKKIKEFVEIYELNNKVKLQMKTKVDLLRSYQWQSGKPSTVEDDARYMTELWKFNCNIVNNKKNKGIFSKKRKDETWVFDNSVVTDGYSISFQVTPESEFRKTVRFPKAGTKPSQPIAQPETPPESNEKEFLDLGDEELNTWLSKNPYYLIANDPGKSDISCMTNGKDSITYTKKERNRANFAKVRDKQSRKLRHRNYVVGSYANLENPSVHDYECSIMSMYRRNTCYFEGFKEYVQAWKDMEAEGLLLYKKAYFRQAKVLVYNKDKSSEHKYFNKVKKYFGTVGAHQSVQSRPVFFKSSNDKVVKNIETATKHCCGSEHKLVVAWGNWGKSPNLKNSAPTPGIGFRRRAAKHLDLTFTTPEAYTSKTCPSCRTISLENPMVGKEPITKHHLLRCTNVDCHSRWWNRNVAGSFNILYRAYENLQPDQNPSEPSGSGTTLPSLMNLRS